MTGVERASRGRARPGDRRRPWRVALGATLLVACGEGTTPLELALTDEMTEGARTLIIALEPIEPPGALIYLSLDLDEPPAALEPPLKMQEARIFVGRYARSAAALGVGSGSLPRPEAGQRTRPLPPPDRVWSARVAGDGAEVWVAGDGAEVFEGIELPADACPEIPVIGSGQAELQAPLLAVSRLDDTVVVLGSNREILLLEGGRTSVLTATPSWDLRAMTRDSDGSRWVADAEGRIGLVDLDPPLLRVEPSGVPSVPSGRPIELLSILRVGLNEQVVHAVDDLGVVWRYLASTATWRELFDFGAEPARPDSMLIGTRASASAPFQVALIRPPSDQLMLLLPGEEQATTERPAPGVALTSFAVHQGRLVVGTQDGRIFARPLFEEGWEAWQGVQLGQAIVRLSTMEDGLLASGDQGRVATLLLDHPPCDDLDLDLDRLHGLARAPASMLVMGERDGFAWFELALDPLLERLTAPE